MNLVDLLKLEPMLPAIEKAVATARKYMNDPEVSKAIALVLRIEDDPDVKDAMATADAVAKVLSGE